MNAMSRLLDRRFLPLLGPLLLLALWQLMISAQWVKPVLLPPPGATLAHLGEVVASGAIWPDVWATVYRTLASFAIAVAIGVPLGVVLGASEGAYRSVEFLIDFFRSTPSSALIPLFLLIFGITDINKIAIASFGAMLIVLFNSAYGVMNAKKTRVMSFAPASYSTPSRSEAQRRLASWSISGWRRKRKTTFISRSSKSMAPALKQRWQ